MENSLKSFRQVTNLVEVPADIDLLICSICSNILWNQVCCKSCKRFYCSLCVSYYVHKNKVCLCGQKFRTALHNPLMDKQLEKLSFRCPNQSCGIIVKYLDTQRHQAECIIQDSHEDIVNKTFVMKSARRKREHHKSNYGLPQTPSLSQGPKSNGVVSSFLNFQQSEKTLNETKNSKDSIATEFQRSVGELIHKYVRAETTPIDKLVTEPCLSQFSADINNEDNKNDYSKSEFSSSSKTSYIEAKEGNELHQAFNTDNNETGSMSIEEISEKLTSYSGLGSDQGFVKVTVSKQFLLEIMEALEKCSLCQKIILKTCANSCKECKRFVCLKCQNKCKACRSTFCLKCKGLSEENYSNCTKCESDICKSCISFCSKCTNAVCTNCKYSCSKCSSIFCTNCECKKSYCSCCRKPLCKPCSCICNGCKNYACPDSCMKKCKGCEFSFCNNCSKECKNCNWELSADDVSEELVELSASNTVAKALDPCSDEGFVIRGDKEFTKGIHEFEILLNQVQRDCAGYGIGICRAKEYKVWKTNGKQSIDVSKIFLGLTANNYGISPELIGPRHFLKPGQTYKFLIDFNQHKFQITGPETNVIASINSDEAYLPLFTRCHGKFQITVHPLNYFNNV